MQNLNMKNRLYRINNIIATAGVDFILKPSTDATRRGIDRHSIKWLIICPVCNIIETKNKESRHEHRRCRGRTPLQALNRDY